MKKIWIIAGLATLLMAFGLVATAAETVDAAGLYKSKCSSCHGEKGEKEALGSNPIAGMPTAEVETKFKGYLDGSYGGDNKGMMEGILKGLTPEELTALAVHITSFK